MKHKINIIANTLLILLAITFFASTIVAGDHSKKNSAEKKDIISIALEAGTFKTLATALTEAKLVETLKGDGPFTVFAPTNAAFQAVLDSNDNWDSLDDIPLATLITVLTYHVVPGRAYDKDLKGLVDINGELPTAAGQNIALDLNNMFINQTTKIVGVNVNTTNGVIHVIDNVLLP